MRIPIKFSGLPHKETSMLIRCEDLLVVYERECFCFCALKSVHSRLRPVTVPEESSHPLVGEWITDQWSIGNRSVFD